LSSILKIENVTKRYAKHTALDNVSFEVPKGSIFGLLGPNGAGKTSLIRIINQITMADEGQVFFDSERLSQKHISQIGYLPEERGLYKKMKVGEQLIYLSRLKGLPKTEVKKRLKYWFKKLSIQDWWSKKIEDLSKGMQQKVQFVATVLHNPQLIILDEPFSGFDPINANIIKDEILELREKGATIIFSTHRMESVEELCDEIVLINKSKKVLEGKKMEIKEQYKQNIFTVKTPESIEILADSFEVLVQNKDNGHFETEIQLKEGTNTNQLLETLMQKTQVLGFQEKIPSVNDIFIMTVQNQS